MTAPPQIITRALTFNFTPSINTSTGQPDIMEISIIPLGSATDPQSGATFAGGLKTQTVELTSPGPDPVVFNLIPSNSAGLSAPINYRVMWRAGVLGATSTTDFAMPDADITWDQLIAGVGNIINGEVYLQQADLGVPGRVARLDSNGIPTTATGIECITSDNLTAMQNSLTAETVARESADAANLTTLQTAIATQTASALSTANANINNAVGTTNNNLAAEVTARTSAVSALQTQVTNNLNSQGATLSTQAGEIAALQSAASGYATLSGGVLSASQIPPGAITSAVTAANQAGMLALGSTVQVGDLCVRPDGTFLLQATPASTLSNWTLISTVTGVNGQTGSVTLTAAQVGAIPTGGSVSQSQVTGLSTALSNKANQTDMTAVQASIASIADDTTYVHTSSSASPANTIPSSLLDNNMVYLNSSNQLTHKDGTVIPLGSGGTGAVFSVNGQTGIVVLTAANVNAVPVGGSISQSQVTGLSTTLSNKADLSSGVLATAQIPTNIPQASVTSLVSALAAKADLVSSTVPLAQLPSLPQSQVTGLSTLVSGNQLTGGTNAVNRIASLESQIVTLGSGGGGGGGVSTQVPFYTSANTTTPVEASDFSTVVNLHSPWGVDSDGTITGTVGTWYYLYTGVRGADVAYPSISVNGHLSLRKWNESGPADPVYALESDFTTLSTTVGTLATQSALTTLTNTVNTKANQSDLTTLSTTVGTLATQSALATLQTQVNGCATQTSLNSTNATVATLATAASVASLTTTVGTKANQSDMTTAQTNISALQAAASGYATLTGGKLTSSQIPTGIPQANISGLSTTLSGYATLTGGTLTAAQIPTGIPQASVTNLVSNLAAKADLVSGTVPLSEMDPRVIPNVQSVANTAAMTALSGAYVGTIVQVTAGSGAGTYVLSTLPSSTLGNWFPITSSAPPVTSVNTKTGAVVLQASDVGAMASNAAIPISQITGLATQLATYATSSALTSGLAAKTAFSDVQSMISSSSLTKRADYVATSAISSLAGLQSIDGVLVPSGAIILATAQPSSVNNGLWAAQSGTWQRAADYSTGSYLSKDTLVFVANETGSGNGTTSNFTIWQNQAASGFIDTATSTWTKIGYTNPPFAPVAGNGISVAGSTFSANATAGQGILATSGGLQSDPTVVPRKFVGSVPSGSTVAGITHNLNTTTPVVSIWATGSNTLVLAGVTVTSANAISIEFNSPVTSGQYNVVVIG